MNDRPTILLVEDDPNDEELVRMALSEQTVPNELNVVYDGREALDYLLGDDKAYLPDLVLLDLQLPKINGHEVLATLRSNERTRHLPIVIFTSSKEEKDLIKGYEAGANAYVRKPIEYAEFSEALRQLGLFWLVRNERSPMLHRTAKNKRI